MNPTLEPEVRPAVRGELIVLYPQDLHSPPVDPALEFYFARLDVLEVLLPQLEFTSLRLSPVFAPAALALSTHSLQPPHIHHPNYTTTFTTPPLPHPHYTTPTTPPPPKQPHYTPPLHPHPTTPPQ